jgi:glutaminyl-peptide cyclotransferase
MSKARGVRRRRGSITAAFSIWLILTQSTTALAWRDPLNDIPRLPYTIVARLEHDKGLYTQGMVVRDGQLLESSGNYGRSRLIVRGFDRPDALRSVNLPRRWFAEGIAVHKDVLYLLTWREGIVQTYSLPILQPLQRFRYQGDGWGLTSDGRQLIQSDGSHTLVWRDPLDFRETRRLKVHVEGRPLNQLNELEWIDGWLLANVWMSDWIVGIDPRNGQVEWTISLKGMLNKHEQRDADVANGIAWDAERRCIWVTGKYWPWLFALKTTLPPLPELSSP